MSSGHPLIDPKGRDDAHEGSSADDGASPVGFSGTASPLVMDCDVEAPGGRGIGQPAGHEVTDRLAAMIVAPFLDLAGMAYCRLPSTADGIGLTVPLRDRMVRSSLVYLFRERYGFHPGVERVITAIDYVEGRLMATRQAESVHSTCPTWRCFARLLQEEESGSASADEILHKLREVARTNKLLKGAESLPGSATAMGKWLKTQQLPLRASGLELSRPNRRSRKRLWAWQAVERDDAGDTSSLHVSSDVKAAMPHENTESVAPDDTMSDERLREALGDLIDDHGD